MSNIIKFPKRYTYIIVGMENGVWTERPHHGPLETIPPGMSWKARRVYDGPSGGLAA